MTISKSKTATKSTRKNKGEMGYVFVVVNPDLRVRDSNGDLTDDLLVKIDCVKGDYSDLRRCLHLLDKNFPMRHEGYAVRLPDYRSVKNKIHEIFDHARPDPERPLFAIPLATAREVLSLYEGGRRRIGKQSDKRKPKRKSSTNSKRSTRRESGSRRKPRRNRRGGTNWSIYHIRPGDELVFSKNRKITVEALANGMVLYKGKEYRLGTLTNELYRRYHNVSKLPNNATAFWEYEGEIIHKRRSPDWDGDPR